MTKMNRRQFLDRSKRAGLGLAGVAILGGDREAHGAEGKVFRAGAHAMDITPDWWPITVNGGFQPATPRRPRTPCTPDAWCWMTVPGRSPWCKSTVAWYRDP